MRNKARERQLARERYAARKELGLCIKCGEPTTDNTRCEYHRQTNARHCRTHYQKRVGWNCKVRIEPHRIFKGEL